MELFLNFCWLSLLAPAYLLWRQRAASTRSGRRIESLPASPLIFFCVLGCVFVLLFPVISATDDLHAMRPEMEESESAFRNANRGAGATHTLLHSSQPVLPRSASITTDFEQIGTVRSALAPTASTVSALVRAGRAPPVAHPAL